MDLQKMAKNSKQEGQLAGILFLLWWRCFVWFGMLCIWGFALVLIWAIVTGYE